jgi:hypothetical protein
MIFLVVVAGIPAGAVASVTGFGIGSLLTPLLALQLGTKIAVAAVSIPHLLGTALRLWMLRGHVDREVLRDFGLMSAAGGLVGALLHTVAAGPVLQMTFGALLVFAGATGLMGLTERMRLTGWMAWLGGSLSGLLGGLVGNQGGIRTAAMLGFSVRKESFVATATAIALMVDGARVPVYLITQGRDLLGIWLVITAAAIGVIAGTVIGARLLKRVPEITFRRIVSAIVLLLGAGMLFSVSR